MSGWYARNRHLYPANWDKIAKKVKAAANWTCQGCGAPHGKSPHVLTVDHVVDHDPRCGGFSDELRKNGRRRYCCDVRGRRAREVGHDR